MSPYVEDLEAELRAAHARRRRAPRGRWRPAILPVLVAAAVAVAAVLVVLSADGAAPARASIPVLTRPAVDASALRRELGARSAAALALREARSVPTPNGPGYAVPARDGRRLCLVVPDRVDGYGATCAAMALVARRGLVGSLVGEGGHGETTPTVTVAVLPTASATTTLAERGAPIEVLRPRAGVVAVVTRRAATLRFDVPGAPVVTHHLLGPLVATREVLQCPQGGYAVIPRSFRGDPVVLCRHGPDGGPPQLTDHK